MLKHVHGNLLLQLLAAPVAPRTSNALTTSKGRAQQLVPEKKQTNIGCLRLWKHLDALDQTTRGSSGFFVLRSPAKSFNF